MRIALDTQSTLGHQTGIGRYTSQLLAALRRVAPEHEYLELSWGPDVVMRTDRRLRWQQSRLPRHARASRAQMLHCTGFDAPRWKPCPTVLTVHDVMGMLFAANNPLVGRLYWGRWLPASIRWADRVIADSEHTRQDIMRLIGLPAERIDVVYPGVGPAFRRLGDQAALAELRARYDLPAHMILFVGTPELRKGVDTLIAAFGRLAAEIPHGLAIVGQLGRHSEPLQRQVETLGLAGRVRFYNYVRDEDLPGFYNLAELFVYPSRYEGFGLPPLEALACGVPVICSSAASLPEVVGDAAWLCSTEDASALSAQIARLLADAAARAELSRRGPERAGGFAWEQTARQTVEVYQKALRSC